MTDRAFEPPSDDPFEQIAKTPAVGLTHDQSSQNADDPFAQIAQSGGVDQSSVTGAFARGVERNVLPAVGSFPAIGAGAELGMAAGAPFVPFTFGLSEPVGALLGGIGGALLGSTALSSAQNWALSKVPDSWKEKIGLDDRQEQLDQASHPYASFLGGLAPYALTMRPGGLSATAAKLPENATALQHILANPVTARVFGGAAMGAMEIGNEAVSNENLDWRKAALATGFGLVFNRPTRIGEAITEMGARPARTLLGRPQPLANPAAEAPPAQEQPAATAEPAAPAAPTTAREWNETILGQKPPTIAEAGDLGVAGPGITEQTFQGGEETNPAAARAAQETARTEQLTLQGPPKPDPTAIARRAEPDLFTQYDAAVQQRDEFRQWIDEYNAPPPEVYGAMEQRRQALQAQLDAHVASQNGYTGGKQARQLRAHIRDAEAEQRATADRAVAYFSGAAEETADLAMARQHLMAADYRLRDLLPQVQAAYRRAAEATGGETYEHPAQAVNPELTTAAVTSPQPSPEEVANAVKPEAETLPAHEIPAEHPAAVDTGAPAESLGATPAGEAVAGAAAREPGAEAGEAVGAAPAVASAEGSIEKQRDFIRSDVAKQLIAAGRPKEEAEAAGAVEAAYYETRAGRFKGALGSPEELYIKEGARIFARGQRVPSGRPRARPQRDPDKISLLQFLAGHGGISPDDKLAGDLRSSIGSRNKFIPGYGALLRKGGMSLDRAREAAVGAGYLQDAGAATGAESTSSIKDLLKAADRELRGNKVYRIGAKPPEEGIEDINDRLGPPPEEGTETPEYAPKPPAPLSPLMTAADYAELWQRKSKGETTEQTPAGEQGVLPGAERAGQGEMAQRGANAPLRPTAAQKPMDVGLFGDESKQRELFQQKQQTETPEFTKWFGESKVVDESGNPRVVYHGTTQKFDTFDQSKGGEATGAPSAKKGFFFTSDPEVASSYAIGRNAYNENPFFNFINKMTGGYYEKFNESLIKPFGKGLVEYGENVVPAYLAIRNPMEVDFRGQEYRERSFAELIDEAKASGHDGVVFRNAIDQGFSDKIGGKPSDVYVAFEPSQIKSATGNRGTFDPNDPNVLHQATHGGITLNPEGVPGRDWLGVADTPSIVRLAADADASSLMHEAGHKYLADLLRDAEHPQAPQDLRDDAKTTLSWLGVDKADSLTRKAHEKFARGFEQYLREGTAPSQRLAGVFAKFRDWLMNIYKTLKGLGKPINEDIRGVFDRMLATPEERTVITPEREHSPTLADIHEADAALVPPTDADAAQAQVDHERQRAYDEHSDETREIEAELAAYHAEHATEHPADNEPAGPAGQGPGGLSEVHPGGEPAEPVAGGSGVRTQPGAQRAGLGATGGESAGVPGGERGSGEQSGPDANPLAANPAFTFERAASPAVDKAGNIRVENITSVQSLAQAIHDSADRNDDFRNVRGPMTAGQILDLANDLGLDAHSISEQKLADIYGSIDGLASKALALRKVLKDSAALVHNAMQKAAESGDDTDAMAMAQAMARHDMIQGTVAKVTAEIGRGLGMGFKNLEGWQQVKDIGEFAKQATGKQLWQLKAMAKLGAKLDSPDKVSKFLRNAQSRSFPAMVLEMWINGLISGPATHVTYSVGNAFLNAERMLLTGPAAAMLGKLAEARGEVGEHVQLGEVGARAAGWWRGLPAAAQGSIDALRSGVTLQLPGEPARAMMSFAGDNQLVVGKSMTNEPVTWGEVAGDLAGLMRGLRDGVMSTATAIAAGGEAGAPLISAAYSPLGQIPDIAIRGVPAIPLGSALRLPSRMIATLHTFFRASTFSMEKSAIAYRRAATEGLTGDAFAARAADIYLHPDDATMQQAAYVSTEQALMGAGSKFTQALSKLTNTEIAGVKLLKFIDPFVHIASNIIDQSIVRRTPLGLLSPQLRADLMGRADPITGKVDVAARDMAQARMLVGTALSVTFAGLASQGYISGSGPRDPKQGAMWRLAGNQAHSVRIGDTWYDMHRLGPLGMLLGISADLYDVANVASSGDMLTAAAHLQHAVTQNILDESFMRGPASLIQAVEDPTRYGQQYIQNFLGSFVPFSVGMAQMARAADPYSRQARSVMDTIKSKVPSLSETLLPRRDIWGEPLPNLPAVGGRAITAFYEQRVNTDPVNRAMLDLGIAPAQPERKIRNVQLTDGQYDDFTRLAGRMAKLRLDVIVRSPDFQSWPMSLRVNIVNEVIRQSRDAGREMMMMKYPQLMADGVMSQRQRKLGTDPVSQQRRLEMGQ